MTPTGRMSPAENAVGLAAKLARFRRRAWLVLFAQDACVTGAVAALVIEAMMVAARSLIPRLFIPSLLVPSVFVPLVLAAAIVVAAATAFARTPGLRDIAKALDVRLRLQDRLVTAVQFQHDTDAFSNLVVGDALARLDVVGPESAFPFRVSKPGWIAGAAAVAAPIVFVLATTGVPRIREMMRGGRAAGAGTLTMPSQDTSSRAASSDGRTRAPGAATASERRSGTDIDAATTPPANALARAAQQTPGAAPHAAASGTRESIGNRAAGAAAQPAVGGTLSESDAGGVKNGIAARIGTAEQGVARTAAADRSTAAYRAAWSNAERAIAQEKVPSDLRAYVRQYFVAIRPLEDK